MKTILLLSFLLFTISSLADDGSPLMEGVASWYGESHRGKPMANGDRFDPENLTAASWFYPLGTRVRVTLRSQTQCTVIVTITDRGPARGLVAQGRIIDLARAGFSQLAPLEAGLVQVSVQALQN